jgi:hypothetical protein
MRPAEEKKPFEIGELGEVWLFLTYKIVNAGWDENVGFEIYEDELIDVAIDERSKYNALEIKQIEAYIEENFSIG